VKQTEKMEEQNIQRRTFKNNNRWVGVLLLLVGAVLLLRQTGYPIPDWIFSWQMILILVGLFIGIRHGFKDFSWLIMVIIGFAFLSDDIWPGAQIKQYAIPIIIISVGLLFFLSPRRMCGGRGKFRRHLNRFESPSPSNTATDDVSTIVPYEGDKSMDTELDIVSIFSGVKKRVLSKQFKGGDVVCVFGGAEVNLTNADFISPVVLDVTMIFGGTKLIVPANWELRSEVAAIFGGIDDKRPQPSSSVPEKTIILKGTLMFGGIEVNSFPL
jgi:predicted membrane protein